MRKEFALIVYTVINEYSIFITQYTSPSLASGKGKSEIISIPVFGVVKKCFTKPETVNLYNV